MLKKTKVGLPIYGGRFLDLVRHQYYVEITEEVPAGYYGCPRSMPITYVKSLRGLYLGDKSDADNLVWNYGITRFYLRARTSKTCTVGYSPSRLLWYGWSHRAIKGFKTRREAVKFAGSVR